MLNDRNEVKVSETSAVAANCDQHYHSAIGK